MNEYIYLSIDTIEYIKWKKLSTLLKQQNIYLKEVTEGISASSMLSHITNNQDHSLLQ